MHIETGTTDLSIIIIECIDINNNCSFNCTLPHHTHFYGTVLSYLHGSVCLRTHIMYVAIYCISYFIIIMMAFSPVVLHYTTL